MGGRVRADPSLPNGPLGDGGCCAWDLVAKILRDRPDGWRRLQFMQQITSQNCNSVEAGPTRYGSRGKRHHDQRHYSWLWDLT